MLPQQYASSIKTGELRSLLPAAILACTRAQRRMHASSMCRGMNSVSSPHPAPRCQIVLCQGLICQGARVERRLLACALSQATWHVSLSRDRGHSWRRLPRLFQTPTRTVCLSSVSICFFCACLHLFLLRMLVALVSRKLAFWSDDRYTMEFVEGKRLAPQQKVSKRRSDPPVAPSLRGHPAPHALV
jgi:hypothetical protein